VKGCATINYGSTGISTDSIAQSLHHALAETAAAITPAVPPPATTTSKSSVIAYHSAGLPDLKRSELLRHCKRCKHQAF
jgi:hypothetical protein